MHRARLSAPTILVPVDFDEASRRAVASAVELASVLRGRVVVLHVVPPSSLPEGTRVLPVDASEPAELAEYASARARRLLDEHFTSVLVTGVEVRKEARSGHVVDTILQAIDGCGANLVVVGTHGRRGAARFLLGSVAESVLRRSPVPVMIVREEDVVAGREHDHALEGAAVVSGALAGAATGAIAGPAGAAAGGALGALAGALAGRVLQQEDARLSGEA